MPINCACDDTTGYRTLAQLRTELYTRLGFVDPMANIATRTLALLRADIARRMGMAAQVAGGSYPPGSSDLIDGFINEAQQILFRRLELDNGAVALPARMDDDADVTTLDYVQVQNLAIALYKSHQGKGDAKVYFEIVERYLSDLAIRRPPNAAALCTNFLTDAQRQLVRRYAAVRVDRWFTWNLVEGERFYDLPDNNEARQLPTPVNAAFSTSGVGGSLAAGAKYYRVSAINAHGETLASTETTITTIGATSTVTVNWVAVTTPDGASAVTGYKIYGRGTGAELLIATVGLVTTYVDTGALTPAGALPSANTTAECDKTLDSLRVNWVGVARSSAWTRLICGIPPDVLGTSVSGYPTHYDIRQCLEVWPAPAADEGTLQIRAGFQLEAFAADGDKPTVDDHLVFLFALANAKAHWKHADAEQVMREFEVMLGGVVAGSHKVDGYLPQPRARSTYVEPVPTVPFA